MKTSVERIRELLEYSGLSNVEFAEKTRLNPATISHILSGRNKPSLQVMENIKASFTNVNLDYLITGSGKLFNDITNVNNPPSENPSLFPMEGVRHASVPGETPLYRKGEKEKTEPEATPPVPVTDSPIERIVIFFRDGSFKSYEP